MRFVEQKTTTDDDVLRAHMNEERARLESEHKKLHAALKTRRVPRLYDHRESDLWYAQRKLEDLGAIEKALAEEPEARLLLLDMRSGARGKAVIAVGDVGAASRIAVTVPGMNTTPGRSIVDMTREAKALRECATSLAQRHVKNDSFACIAWIGYETPHAEIDLRRWRSRRFGPGWGDGFTGALRVMSGRKAKKGAIELSGFLTTIHKNTRPDITVLGHSYGSLTVSYSLRALPRGIISSVVFFGSPGIRVRSVKQLGLRPGRVFAMLTPTDFVRRVHSRVNKSVVDLPGVEQLATQEGIGPADGQLYEAAHGHAEYPRVGANGRVRMSGYNMACVLADCPDLAVRGE